MAGMSIGEILSVVMAGLFSLAFAAWARRLDKALDLLEKIQEQMHTDAVKTERRITRLESAVQHAGLFSHHRREDDNDG